MAPNNKAATELAPENDGSMADAATPEVEEETDFSLEEPRIRILPGSQDTAASFEFKNEDHTLGNALRWIIMKNPDVEFCGYSIPHPSEPLMNVRIQTYENTTAVEALEKGLDDLMDLCDVVADKFIEAKVEFANKMEES